MELRSYLKKQKLKFKKFALEKEVFDIILYGSFARGREKPRDIDILLIFEKTSLKERMVVQREFKKLLGNEFNFDVKSINLFEMFDKDFLARQGILVEGHSLIFDRPFSERIGFKGFSLFSYSLSDLNHSSKTKFTYALIGRNTQGMIKNVGGEHLGRGVVIVPIENSEIFEDFLKKWKVSYKKKEVLVYD